MMTQETFDLKLVCKVNLGGQVVRNTTHSNSDRPVAASLELLST